MTVASSTDVQRLAALIREAGSVVALTGAGISVPSGIPDFRSPGTGLWEKVDPMEVAHIDVFGRDPERFWQFYGDRFATLRTKQPNVERGYTAPALKFLCVVGFIASAAAILIGFVPPSQFENGSDGAYVGLILAGTVLLGLLPPWLFLKFRKPGWKSADAEVES